ncbi:MAG TPA: bile acid:sodium symporter family protein [Verrucomicrobiae bacterium]
MKFKFDWFLTGLVVAVLLAWFYPEPGAKGGWLHADLLNKCGVALIFFLHGVALSFAALKAGTLRWPLHLAVQSTTYLIFPVIGFAIYFLLRGSVDENLRLGFFFLCALPSTVSSSVAMTAAARGNVPTAVFNATLSSLIGVVVTPLWMGLVMKTTGQSLPIGKVILDLIMWLVLPLVCGQLCRPWLGAFVHKHKKGVHVADRMTILILVYTSFAESTKQGVWSGQGVQTVVMTVVGSAVLFSLVMFITGKICDRMKFPMDERITVLFCGSKKSLAAGVPMAQLIFGAHPALGLLLLPIMVYHSVQLIICGWLAGRWAERKDT